MIWNQFLLSKKKKKAFCTNLVSNIAGLSWAPHKPKLRSMIGNKNARQKACFGSELRRSKISISFILISASIIYILPLPIHILSIEKC